jgi:hypothetical protein
MGKRRNCGRGKTSPRPVQMRKKMGSKREIQISVSFQRDMRQRFFGFPIEISRGTWHIRDVDDVHRHALNPALQALIATGSPTGYDAPGVMRLCARLSDTHLRSQCADGAGNSPSYKRGRRISWFPIGRDQREWENGTTLPSNSRSTQKLFTNASLSASPHMTVCHYVRGCVLPCIQHEEIFYVT